MVWYVRLRTVTFGGVMGGWGVRDLAWEGGGAMEVGWVGPCLVGFCVVGGGGLGCGVVRMSNSHLRGLGCLWL